MIKLTKLFLTVVVMGCWGSISAVNSEEIELQSTLKIIQEKNKKAGFNMPLFLIASALAENDETNKFFATNPGTREMVNRVFPLTRYVDLDWIIPVGDSRYTALHVAAASGNLPAIRWLLKNGADINTRTPDTKSTPLSYALGKENYDAARLLIDNGAMRPTEQEMTAREYTDQAKKLVKEYKAQSKK